jgi:hypothetical protein
MHLGNINGDVRVRPSDGFKSKVNNPAAGEKIVVEPVTHGTISTDEAEFASLKDDQTLVVRGDIIVAFGNGLHSFISIKGSASDLIKNVTIRFDGGSLERDTSSDSGQLIEANYAQGCYLIDAYCDNGGAGIRSSGVTTSRKSSTTTCTSGAASSAAAATTRPLRPQVSNAGVSSA